jgi:hypothetical protein
MLENLTNFDQSPVMNSLKLVCNLALAILNNNQKQIKTDENSLFQKVKYLASTENLQQNHILPLRQKLQSEEFKPITDIFYKIRQLKNHRIKLLLENNTFEMDKINTEIENLGNSTDGDLLQKAEIMIYQKENYEQYGKLNLHEKEAVNFLQEIVNNSDNKNNQGVKFVSPDVFLNYKINQENCIYLKTGAEIMEIPTNMFVSAEGFVNWQGRGNHQKKDGESSKTVIENYAKLPADTAPPVTDLEAYLDPSGKLCFVSGNSHRVAAAILRGDPTIKFRGNCTLFITQEELP